MRSWGTGWNQMEAIAIPIANMSIGCQSLAAPLLATNNMAGEIWLGAGWWTGWNQMHNRVLTDITEF